MATALTYEDLRKHARQLENEIDLKLVAYNKLGAGIHTATITTLKKTPKVSAANPAKKQSTPADKAPLLGDNANSDEENDNNDGGSGDEGLAFSAMSSEIEGLLKKLSQVNERMGEQPVNGAAMLHTLQRHRDILADLSRDFRKTASQHEARRERADLMRGGTTTNDFGINNRRDIYLKESSHIHNSDRLINEQISIAMETKEHLSGQRQTFKRLQTRFNDISNRYPMINSLLQRINLRKRRDSIIIGAIVGGCTILMLLYMFH